ncbi:MAG: TatD family hydrolase [Candidatus Krumholzibacteriia bacterium]
MIDSHCHLNRPEFVPDRPQVLAAAAAAGVGGFLNVGYDPATSGESVALAASDPRILATVGIHPHDAALLAAPDGTPLPGAGDLLDRLQELAAHPRTVAIGEIGLDYFRDLSPRPAQRTALALQLQLAVRLDLPVVLHVRDAWQEILGLVDELGLPPRRGVLHAFAGDARAVAWAKERGFLLGIGGPVTYKNSTLPELVRQAGPDLLLLETDAPWLPPVPHRGGRNEPAYLALTCARVAELLALAPAELAARTSANFRALFGVEDGFGA